MSSDFPADRRPRFHAGRFLAFILGAVALNVVLFLLADWIIRGHGLTANPDATFRTVTMVVNTAVILVGMTVLRPWIWGIKK